jgi:hypothetical protein
VGEVIDELKDGFDNEIQDVVVFLRENVRTLMHQSGGSEMGPMMNMGTEQIMNLVTKSYANL